VGGSGVVDLQLLTATWLYGGETYSGTTRGSWDGARVCGCVDLTTHLLCQCTVPVAGLHARWINFDSGGQRRNETESGCAIYSCTARVSVADSSTGQSNP